MVEPDAQPQHIPDCRWKLYDTIPAGDSHCEGTIAGLACGMDLRQAALLGNEVAAIVVTRPGADGAPGREELRQFQSQQQNGR